VRITYQRDQFTNVYPDKLDPLEEPADDRGSDVKEAAWRTAVEAARRLVGEPDEQIDPNKLYDKLKPFEERVEQDIENSNEG
jgi:hypothetical protein